MWRFVLIAALNTCWAQDSSIVTLAQGILKGIRSKDGFYESFNGIPYAGVPGKEHRFKGPPPATSWEGIRDASDDSATCLTRNGRQTFGSEDCLYLNVYRPTPLPGAVLFPVLFWIHGGGFSGGSGDSNFFGPGHLVRHGVAVVTVNYRVGVAGFLCSAKAGVPGNAGLKDVVAALRWVRDNIIAFGGNANAVTVAGQGTGAAIADYMTLSPMAEGLFHRVIAQSGTALHHWAFQKNTDERVLAVASRLNPHVTTIEEARRDILKADLKDIVKASIVLDDLPYFNLAPCIDDSVKGQERFLYDTPQNLLTSGRYAKVSFMLGFNSEEAYVLAPFLVATKASIDDVVSLLPIELEFASASEKRRVGERVRAAYAEETDGVMSLLTDALFATAILRSARLHAAGGAPVYAYEFSYLGEKKEFKYNTLQQLPKYGAAHADELAYLFQQQGHSSGSDSDIIVNRLTVLWTNFVKNGDPTPLETDAITVRWPLVSADNLERLRIDTNLEVGPFPNAKRVQLWDELYDKYYKS